MERNRQQGVALVITLIFLSVITVMAVALLAVANRGRTASRESSNRAIARQVAEIGEERAEAEIMARALSGEDLMGPGLTVSVNYVTNIPPSAKYGYPSAIPDPDYVPGFQARDLFDNDDLATISGLQFDPRPPVFVEPDRALPGETNGFRFFLDLNRNGLFEDTGELQAIDPNGVGMQDADGFPIFENVVGDPQWIGVLRDPNQPHSPDNHFIGRYAYLIHPVGRTLDLNQIHNDAKLRVVSGFRRNEGVGPWEINLAAFLAELNTNLWLYENYNLDLAQPSGNPSNPADAFLNASFLVNRRYLPDASALSTFAGLFPQAVDIAPFDLVDAYAVAPVPLRGQMQFRTNDFDDVVFSWIGAPNRTNFYSVHDFFKGQAAPDFLEFQNRLQAASTNLSSYDRHTYYRMLSQLGTESVPEPPGKINVNYVSGFTNTAGGWFSETNFVSWSSNSTAFINDFGASGPDLFFNLTADRLLREEMRSSIHTNWWQDRSLSIWDQGGIPVTTNGISVFTNANGFVEKVYSRRVHQLLQLTANIYNANHGSKQGEAYPYYPTVFKPLFYSDGVDLFIRGYTSEASTGLYNELTGGGINWMELDEFAIPGQSDLPPETYFYEIPVVVGARKGFPNFNEVAVQTVIDASRKIEIRKDNVNGPTTETNMMFIMGVQNNYGLETWYPYTEGRQDNTYPRELEMYVNYRVETVLTNEDFRLAPVTSQATYFRNIQPNTLMGPGLTSSTNQFSLPPVTNEVVLPNSVYYSDANGPGQPGFEIVSGTNRFENNIGIFTNQWGLEVSARLVYYLFDRDPVSGLSHLVDAVTLNGLDTTMDVSETLNARDTDVRQGLDDLWNITPFENINRGVRDQINLSAGLVSVPSSWAPYGGFNPASGNTVEKAIASFRQFIGLPEDERYSTNGLPPLGIAHQAPFSPSKKIVATSSWQVNDPMVHYTVEDLMDGTNIVDVQVIRNQPPSQYSLQSGFNLGKINTRYDPWGGRNFAAGTPPAADKIDLSTTDPGLFNADDYAFPTNKFPNIGWLGRVHRGTPWQTVYLKDRPTDVQPWVLKGGLGVDGSMMPTNDWRLLDYFSASLGPQATRGRMSINQTNAAAWSAVLSGVAVTTLDELPNMQVFADDVLVEPASYDPRVQEIVAGITAARSNGTFTSLGDILAVPQLSSASPFLNPPHIPNAAIGQTHRFLRDEDYERIPQQIMGLLTVANGGPRFVVYTFAQTLTPDEVNRGNQYFKLPINYRVSSETATRTVLRLEYDRESEDPFDPNYNEPDFNSPRMVVERYNLLPLE